MSIKNGLFTSESVSAGHPDKLCDRISDTILDEFLHHDPHARVACETMAAHGKIIVTGEFQTSKNEVFDKVQSNAVPLVRQALRDIGYGSKESDIDPDTCDVEVLFNNQSSQISGGVDQGGSLGAGDQGMMFGYATDETEDLMPLSWSLATDLIAHGTQIMHQGSSPLKPDAKSQVTVRYVGGQPVGIQAVVLSWQHHSEYTVEKIREWLVHNVIDPIIPESLRLPEFKLYLNPAGYWTIGGSKGDTGLTGRKIIVDSYGGACPHGGGAFSGKDPTKVDRSGAYAARWVAKNIVAAGLAKRCTIQIAYAIGVSEPVSISVDTHRTGSIDEKEIEALVMDQFDLTPSGIIQQLDLLRPIYKDTSSLGHFGKYHDPLLHKWECTGQIA
ncbi:MAG: methionine adenosyltransferase [Gammaproteobacteria bacterium]|nr:methionine adenosyltransferase [Gammaproteobacteria bacterium]